MRSKKLKWDRLGNGFDLICLNPDQLDQEAAKILLRKIKVIYDDFKKPFNKDASKLWQEWIENPRQPLQETTYCVLSNWFLTESCAASRSIRAGLALILWRKLFCAIPDGRLTKWEQSGSKVVPCKFERWWNKQQKCQGERDNSVKGRVISAWKQANKPNWNIEQTLKVCVRIDSEFEEAGLQPAPRFRDAVKYLVNWVQGCHFPWLNPR